MSLRTKFILFFMVIFSSLAALTGLYFEYSIRKSFKEQISSNLNVIAEENESIYFAFIGQLKTLAINWSSDNYIKELAEKIVSPSLSETKRAQAVDEFGVYLREKKMLYSKSVVIVDILDEHGIVVASSRTDRIGLNEKTEEDEHGAHFFSKTINANFGEAFVRSVVFEEDEATDPMFHVTTRLFSVALDEQGSFIPLPAVLLVHFASLPDLTDLMRGKVVPSPSERLTESGFVRSFQTSDSYIVNRERLLLTPTRFEPYTTYTTHISTTPVEECFQNNREVTGEYLNHQGILVFGSSMCIIDDGIVLLKEVNKDEAYDLFFSLRNRSIILGTIVAIVVIITTYTSAYVLLRRITTVSRAAEKIAHGDFTVRVPIEGRDEIATLAHTFNIMAEKLHSFYQNLEYKVAKRTRLLRIDRAKDEALLQSIGEGIVATDKNGVIIKVNRATERMFGWSERELVGKIFPEIVPAYTNDGELIPYKNRPVFSVIARNTTTTLLANMERKDKTRFPASTIVAPVILGGVLVGTIAAIRDISKEYEVEKMRLDLLSLASHQLRTPLSGTKWLIETLRKGIHGPLGKEQGEYIEEIYKINERMTGLVSDMLSALRIESGVGSFQSEEVSISSLFSALAITMTPAAQAKHVFLRFGTQTSASLTTAQELLRNILESFISNAITYSSEGTEVFVNATEEKDAIVFSVTDHGIGIPKDEQAGIFSRFYRATNARTVNTRGSGLGLYIAAMLAKKIRAEVHFVSEKNKGSTFYVRVPKETTIQDKADLPNAVA